jgi:hypothetical protein
MADEGDSLGGRLGRYARVGTSVGGLAARWRASAISA